MKNLFCNVEVTANERERELQRYLERLSRFTSKICRNESKLKSIPSSSSSSRIWGMKVEERRKRQLVELSPST